VRDLPLSSVRVLALHRVKGVQYVSAYEESGMDGLERLICSHQKEEVRGL
jgi:hypothetical protein